MNTLFEQKLIQLYKKELIEYFNSHPEHFAEAMKLAISDKQPYSWRAAFLLGSCITENDERIIKYIPSIVKNIKDKKDGHQRELLKILYKMNLKDKYEGEILDICIDLWEQIHKTPSIRMTAFKYIIKIARNYTELLNELSVLTQEHYLHSLSPGIKSSIKRIVQEEFNLDKISKAKNSVL